MNISTELGLSLNNNYHIELIDSTSGKVKQSGDFHNIAISNFAGLLTTQNLSSSEVSMNLCNWNDITFGIRLGSGTTQPSASDTGLAQPLWSAMVRDNDSLSVTWPNDYTARINASYTFPATSAYVGNVTELGLIPRSRQSGAIYSTFLVTRALLTDSEGQQISFNKTDLDILVINVTVEISLSSSDSSFNILKKCVLLQFISGIRLFETSSTQSYWYINLGYLSLAKFDADVLWPDALNLNVNTPNYNTGATLQYLDYDAKLTTNAGLYYKGSGANDISLRYAKARLTATDITNESYYKYLVVPAIGYWDLTDPSVFPVYNITGISIGTGDGSTTEFTCPLSYFKLNTDKVYKNGQLLTRGVDYTLSNVSNVNGLAEVSEAAGLTPVRVYSEVDKSEWANSGQVIKPLIVPAINRSYYVRDTPDDMACGFRKDMPLYFEYAEPATFNGLRSTGTSYINPSQAYNSQYSLSINVQMYLDYSIDGSTYIQVGQAATTVSGAFSMEFEDTTAKYWRLRTDYAATQYGYNYYVSCKPMSPDVNESIYLYRKAPNIVFTNPPADGDLLTMDVSMDRIMKNSNYVVDAECQINFSY